MSEELNTNEIEQGTKRILNLAYNEMDLIDHSIFERTTLATTSSKGDVDLSRRQLTVLRLIDGVTPVSTFQEHLKSYDVSQLVNELAEKGLVKLIDGKTRPEPKNPNTASKHWRSIVTAMLPSLFSGEGSAEQINEDRTSAALDSLEDFPDDLDSTLVDWDPAEFDAANAEPIESELLANAAEQDHEPKAPNEDTDASLTMLSKYAPGLSDDMVEALGKKSKPGDKE